MAKSQIAKWEKRLRYSMVTIFLLLTVLNGVFSDFDNMKHFYFSNNTILLTFHLYKIFGYFGVIFLFCFINFLSLNITEWIIKKKMILHKKVDKYGEA